MTWSGTPLYEQRGSRCEKPSSGSILPAEPGLHWAGLGRFSNPLGEAAACQSGNERSDEVSGKIQGKVPEAEAPKAKYGGRHNPLVLVAHSPGPVVGSNCLGDRPRGRGGGPDGPNPGRPLKPPGVGAADSVTLDVEVID
jgi:hypothetical protein